MRLPFFTTTHSLSASATISARFRGRFGRPCGLPDWPGRKRVASGGRQLPTRIAIANARF
jgi:hypothetical protein